MKRIFDSVFLFFYAMMLFSCAMLEDSFNEPVRQFFEMYTETAALVKAEIEYGHIISMDGRYTVASDQDLIIKYYLRNPQAYDFRDRQNLFLSFPSLSSSAGSDEWWAEYWKADPLSKYIVGSDSVDKSVMKLVLKKELLRAVEGGFDISPTITIRHPATTADFGSYSMIPVKCNTPPLEPSGALVMVYEGKQKYVLCFNMGDFYNFDRNGLHKDIKSISINSTDGKSAFCEFSASPSGELSLSSTSGMTIQRTPPADMEPNPESFSGTFTPGDNPFYVLTDTYREGSNVIYSFTATDKGGLSSGTEISVYSMKIDKPVLSSMDRSGNPIAELDSAPAPGDYSMLAQNSKGLGSIRAVTPTTGTSRGTTEYISDVILHYRLYRGTASGGNITFEASPYSSGTTASGSVDVSVLPCYTKVELWGSKTKCVDSDHAFFYVKPYVNTVYVREGATGTGSEENPVGSIGDALAAFDSTTDAGNRIVLVSDVTRCSFPVGGFTARVMSSGGRYNVGHDSAAVSIEAGQDVTFADVTVNVNLNVNGGKLTLSGSAAVASDKVVDIGSDFIYSDGTLTSRPAAVLKPSTYSDHAGLNHILVKPAGSAVLNDEITGIFSVYDPGDGPYYVALKNGNGVLTKYLVSNITVNNGPEQVKFTVNNISGNVVCGVVDKDGNALTASEITVGLSISDNVISKVTRTNQKYAILGVKSLVDSISSAYPGEKIDLFMSAKVNGKFYSGKRDVPVSTPIKDVVTYEAMVELINSGIDTTEIVVELGADLTLTGNETLIKTNEANPFNGIFDGHGHTVTVNRSNYKSDYPGLITYIGSAGVVKNLVIRGKVEETNTHDDSHLGAISTYNYGTIYNCINYADISDYTFWSVGGLVGVNCGTMYNCANYGAVRNDWHRSWAGDNYARAAGIAGSNMGGTIVNCWSSGNIYAEPFGSIGDSNCNGYPAAITSNNENGQIQNCYWKQDCCKRGGTTMNEGWNLSTGTTSNTGSATASEACNYFNSKMNWNGLSESVTWTVVDGNPMPQIPVTP